ncbi:copia protein [Tanacetum coccineum]
MLTTPKEKEELIMYLAAAKEAISAVLMTERDGKQMPIYFVSRALQAPKVNYTLMEKLILALVYLGFRGRLEVYDEGWGDVRGFILTRVVFVGGGTMGGDSGLDERGEIKMLVSRETDIMFSVCLCALFQEDPKTSHLEAVKRIFRYIKGTMHLGLWYPKGSNIETIVYADLDHARDYVDRKSTSGVCTFMGCCLTSWFSKKQTALSISTTEAEYVSAGKACQQALWRKQALVDYDIRLDDIPIMCDNKGAIDLSKNSVQHSRTKHIEIRHHFLRDNVQKGNISIEKVSSEDNIADILTKPLKREPFNYLHLGLGMIEQID